MRRFAWFGITIMIASILFFTVSCAKEAVQTQPEQVSQPTIQKPSEPPPQQPEPADRLQAEAAAQEAALREAAAAAFVNDHVHFEFNSAALTGQSQQTLSAKAEYMRLNPEIMITVEGHCDERGTESYNLALGHRRADSVKNFLVDLGIGGNRVDIISFGEEKPIALERNEAAWAMNRRAQFMIN